MDFVRKLLEVNVRKITFQKLEKGQVLPILVVGLIIVITMTALILDGGSIMVNRRRAQNAADAGALAGAHDLCLNKAANIVTATALDYATSKNNASSAYVEIDGKVITVTTEIHQNSFFARIFNQTQLTSSAVAAAGCFSPAVGNYLMPIAWSCRPPVGGSDSPDCNAQELDWATQLNPLLTGNPSSVVIDGQTYTYTPNFFKDNYLPQIYIIMDSQSTASDIICKPAVGWTVDCDLNNDGRMDIEGQGNRSWLDLDGGGGGAAEMKDWIKNGLNQKVVIHTWFSSQPGNDQTLYSALNTRVGQVVFIVVFNQICDDNPDAKPECKTAAHANFPLDPGESDIVVAGSSKTYFHAVGYAAFYITCVHSNNGDKCPGFDRAVVVNPSIKNNVNSVEGYFVSGYPFPQSDTSGGGVDMGNYIVSLTK